MARTAFLAAALLLSGAAGACGYCVEDKIAAVYDHALVTRSVQAGHPVVFYHLDGPVPPDAAAAKALVAIAESVPGVDKGSVRLSQPVMTIAFAYDARRTTLAAAQNALDRKLAARKLSLMPMRVIERTAELKDVAGRYSRK